MQDFVTNWAILVGVFTIALASPGPDFVIAVRNSIQYSRRIGILTAFGFAAGVAVHVSYCLMGLATLISQSILIFNILKFIGAAYLFYVGVSALRSKGFTMDDTTPHQEQKKMTDWQALQSGFITNLFNPKATLFFLALFTQILDPNIPHWASAIYGLTCILMTALWFSIVATVLTTPKIRGQFIKYSKWIDRVCGGVLIALGLRLALTKAGQ
jgi:RhtB (resistance to homoserine/threonine) family protein